MTKEDAAKLRELVDDYAYEYSLYQASRELSPLANDEDMISARKVLYAKIESLTDPD